MHHLRVLEECGLVRSEKVGTVRTYSLRPEGFQEAEKWLRRIAGSGASSRLNPLPKETLFEFRQLVLPVRSISSSASNESTGAEQVLPRQR
jgi:DNA-binding transcriptional ArsR family regulator